MDIQETIENLVAERLEPSYFIVEISVTPSKVKPKISIVLDGDEGIGIDYCAEISRKVGQVLDAENLMELPYTLEVSSPGVGEPLKLFRQYLKNVGRKVKAELNNDTEVTGKLESVNSSHIFILPEKKKKEKLPLQAIEISLPELKKIQVLVSFD